MRHLEEDLREHVSPGSDSRRSLENRSSLSQKVFKNILLDYYKILNDKVQVYIFVL